jgi:transposase InsO family protein
MGLKPLTTPVCSPRATAWRKASKTMKRDYVAFMPKPDAATAARNLAIAFEHYNEKHPHSALKYRSPREFRRRTIHQP